MPRVISAFSKEQEKAATAASKTWTKEQRDIHARLFRALRKGTLRLWAVDERLRSY